MKVETEIENLCLNHHSTYNPVTKLVVIPKDSLISFIKVIKQMGYEILTDLFAADFPEEHKRFEVVYNLLNIEYNMRLYVKVKVADKEALPSIVNIHASALWYEREVFDMFGITFTGNPDLRRILTDYGFTGHPLRKDFPVTGFKEVSYSEELKGVVYKPVLLQQEFRNFDFASPWQGPSYPIAPHKKDSDEK